MRNSTTTFRIIHWGFFMMVLMTSFLTACQKNFDYEAYLFAYFVGNGPGQEAVHFAISEDGFNYRALNNNQPVISADTISSRGGVRDPHILRGEDGNFYMVLTDLYVPNDGWTNVAMVMLKSKDLIHWTHSIVNIPEAFPEKFSDVTRVWAPQTIFDEKNGKYMVYFSMLQPGGADIIYYSYANEDFTGLATEPEQLFFHPEGKSCIDGDIVKKDGKFHLFFKTEGHGNGIKKAVSDNLTEGYLMQDKYLQQTKEAVEGAGTFKLIGQDKYILMYDVYMKGRYQFTESTDLENFKVVDEKITMNFHPRHGCVIPITGKELERLIAKWGTMEALGFTGSNSKAVKSLNVVFNHEAGEIYLPVKNGANLASLDPQFTSFLGADFSPKGAQDFSNGPVNYTLRVEGVGEKQYKVIAAIDNNPVLDGYYADPEIIYSHKEGKYYLYPTSDGHDSWSGKYFEVFSSFNLVDWKNEGVILDLPKDVPWGPRNAWAPACIEKKTEEGYKYYYYFTAAQKIGVAVSDEPEGPFVDSGKPLIDWKPKGISGGQEIDPDVFHDPISGDDYLYWGNGYMAVVKLNGDMVSVDRSSLKVITPDRTFREGTEVFFRNGKYYFLWSEDVTRSPNYRVRYATSDSPTGPLNIPENNLILAKDASKGIYGTGHNSVIQIPGKDEWYIVYHRFNRPRGIKMGHRAGFHREVCIDRLEFDEEGAILPVEPTLKGINPL
ncbi:family 43 glycosylhydrolase [Thermophagus sp. OGC60D27]|uniref:family 43 glycosylhydrolase n=1 Tax=Thermophagus sp. OGC60D27 TaxID=3458415 RepID=UPI004037CB70